MTAHTYSATGSCPSQDKAQTQLRYAAIFGCTTDQLRRQHARNASQLLSMARIADGINGFTPAQLSAMAAQSEALSHE